MAGINILAYALASLAVSLGMLCGVLLGRIAKEELKPGMKCLILLQNAALLAIFIALIAFKQPYLCLVAAAAIASRITASSIANAPASRFYYLAYILFSILFFASWGKPYFAIVSSLIFVFGLPSGSLLFMKKNWLRKSAAASLAFLIPSLILLGISLLQ